MQTCLACSGEFTQVRWLGNVKTREAALAALRTAAVGSKSDRHVYVDHLLDEAHVLSLCDRNLDGRPSDLL